MTFDWSIVWAHASELLQGTELTIMLAVVTMAIAVPGGIILALLRLSGSRVLAAIATSFTEFFRNLPLILVIYAAYYMLPLAFDIAFSPIATALIALSLNVSAYNGETFRAGIASIRRGKSEAALALGMSRFQTMREVVLPQAIRRGCRCSPAPGYRCSRTRRWSLSSRSANLRIPPCAYARKPSACWRC